MFVDCANMGGGSRQASGVAAWWPQDSGARLCDLLLEVHDEQKADAEFEKLCAEGFEALKEACAKAIDKPEFRVAPFDWTPDPVLEAFGSTRQGTALKSSDLDVRMTFEQFEVHRPDRQIFYLKGIADAPGDRFKVLKIISTSRVPVVRLRFDGKLDVDLSMGGTFEGGDLAADTVGVDHCIRTVIAAASDVESVRHFVCLVKVFAKANGLVDAHLGYLSSTSWTLLAINFLQSQRCLPAASGLLSEDGDNKASKRPRLAFWPAKLTPGLFARFFAYMEAFGAAPHRVSVLHGKHYPLYAVSWTGKDQHPLFLEFPSQRRKETNVSTTLQPNLWQQTVNCCRKARRALQPQGADTWAAGEATTMVALGRLFACVGGDDGKGMPPTDCCRKGTVPKEAEQQTRLPELEERRGVWAQPSDEAPRD